MLVLSVASAVCSVVKMVVAEACWAVVKSRSVVSRATWLVTIWAGVGGVGWELASVDVNASNAKAARIRVCMRV